MIGIRIRRNNLEPDPNLHFDIDPDSTLHFDADPDAVINGIFVHIVIAMVLLFKTFLATLIELNTVLL